MIKLRKAVRMRTAAKAIIRGPQRPGAAATPSADLQRLLHELQAQQLELEMQNDELRRVQRELEAERTRYFDHYHFAPVGCCTLGEHGIITQANLTFARLFGSAPEAMIGQTFARLVLGEDLAIYGEFRQQMNASATSSPCEVRMMKSDGASFWAQIGASAGHDNAQRPVLRLVVSDISERKHAEETIQEQRAFAQMIAENIGDFIAILDRDGRRLYNSPSYQQFFGGGCDLQGTDSFADVHPDDQERIKRLFRETVLTGIGVQTDYRLLIADGSVHDMESRGSVIKDKDGRVVRVVVVSHDVTERKRLEAQVRYLAFHDTLTQLPNRRLLSDRLSQNMAVCARSGCHGAVMFLDLDGFKGLNDTHGHAAGDALLIKVAERLKSNVREVDTVARIGGDEFVVMISELDVDERTSLAQAALIAEKIRVALAAPYRLVVPRDGRADEIVDYRCTTSIGVVLYANQEVSQGEILALADGAMYRAKTAAQGGICFHAWTATDA